ncbi:MAG: zf-HC2 domain-containing protein, partial [Clostridia bacterium]|nr:zf-HC2 domain-containing protein [Clostridia bacterium]
MMRNECSIVRDLLPLYVEGLVSAETEEFIREHLSSCESCRDEFESMKSGIVVEENVTESVDLKIVKRKLMVSRLQTVLATAVSTSVLLLAIGFPDVSFDGFTNSTAFWGLCGAGIIFIIQLALCFKAKKRWLRLFPLYIMLGFFGICILMALGAFGDWSSGFLGNMHILFAA